MALASAADAAPDRIIIENDLGGDPAPYIERVKKRQPMEIHGGCYSACTIYLGNPKACFNPDAVLYFHALSFDYVGATKPVPTRKMTRNERIGTELYMMAYYPAKVKRWIKAKGGLKVTTTEMLTLKGEEMAGMVPLCKDPMREAAIRERKAAIQRQALEELKTMGFKRSLQAMTDAKRPFHGRR